MRALCRTCSGAAYESAGGRVCPARCGAAVVLGERTGKSPVRTADFGPFCPRFPLAMDAFQTCGMSQCRSYRTALNVHQRGGCGFPRAHSLAGDRCWPRRVTKVSVDAFATSGYLAQTMRVVRFHEHGDPSVLRLENLEVGQPGPGEVRIRVEAIGLN